jgi:hypothetical protein
MNIVIPALAFLLVTALVNPGSNTQGPEEAQVQVSVTTLKLEKPQFEWVRCNCPNGTELGLTNSDFIKFQMWTEGLEHQAQQSCGPDFYWPPSTRFVNR